MEKANEKMDKMTDDLSVFLPIFFSEMINSKELKEKLPLNYRILLASKYYEDQPMPMSMIADKLPMSRSHMTGITDKLVKEGLLKRLPDESDRRINRIMVTPEGRKVRDKYHKIFKEHTQQKLSLLSSQELDELYNSIKTIKKVTIKMLRAK